MRNIALSTIATMLLLSGAALSAAEPDKKAGDSDRKICKPEPNSTSRIARKICKTKAEWDQQGNESIDRANLNRNR